jgi:hypothetical protein
LIARHRRLPHAGAVLVFSADRLTRRWQPRQRQRRSRMVSLISPAHKQFHGAARQNFTKLPQLV